MKKKIMIYFNLLLFSTNGMANDSWCDAEEKINGYWWSNYQWCHKRLYATNGIEIVFDYRLEYDGDYSGTNYLRFPLQEAWINISHPNQPLKNTDHIEAFFKNSERRYSSGFELYFVSNDARYTGSLMDASDYSGGYYFYPAGGKNVFNTHTLNIVFNGEELTPITSFSFKMRTKELFKNRLGHRRWINEEKL